MVVALVGASFLAALLVVEYVAAMFRVVMSFG